MPGFGILSCVVRDSSMETSSISLPVTIFGVGIPQSMQRKLYRPIGDLFLLQLWHQTVRGISSICKVAPSHNVPWEAAPKQKCKALDIADNSPSRIEIFFTRPGPFSPAYCCTISIMFLASASSCMSVYRRDVCRPG